MFNLTVRGHDITGKGTGNGTPHELAHAIHNLGIKNVQLSLGMSFPDMQSNASSLNPGMGTLIKNEFAKEDVQIAVLSCYINMIHPDLSEREILLDKFESYIRHAKYFGASMVATETGCVDAEIHYTEENYTDAAFDSVCETVRRLVHCGEKHGTIVAIEPGINHPLYSIARTKELIDAIDSDYLGIIIDATNLVTNENYQEQVQIVREALEQFGDKIVAFHVKDFVVNPDGNLIPVNFGEGLMDTHGLLALIAAHKPYINIVLEETKDEAIAHARREIAR
ncbi:MAG: sugar phosphate isomerase/epimerase [Clostridiales Family XIII bacterium]|jgi:sugar phosphate isomerase/epimerase|nr:sugar phosphate isomerase/epimerase [Clostridiales Family XIII bacterium]